MKKAWVYKSKIRLGAHPAGLSSRVIAAQEFGLIGNDRTQRPIVVRLTINSKAPECATSNLFEVDEYVPIA